MSELLEMAREIVRQLEESEKENKVQLSELEPGNTFKIGDNDFIVLEHTDDGTKVISKGFMKENVTFDDDTRDYNKSHLKSVIEEEIQPLIEQEVGSENLVEHIVDLSSVDMQNEFGECRCKVRPITFDEARRYNNFLPNKDLDDCWWTCTPWSTEERCYEYSITVVSSYGDFDYRGRFRDDFSVRPVCILKSDIFVSKGE